ncbi:hypothetical protein ACFQXA_30730 [Nocardiopsis composta]
MDENTGQGPLRGLDDVDWTGLVPGEGAEIPTLLRTIAAGGTGSMEAVSALFDILRHPGPGYLAAPQTVPFLARIAADEATGAPAEALSLLFELVVPVPAAVVPAPWDTGQWADEVAWAVASDIDAVRDQYLKWREDAPDEQAFRRMSARYDAVARDTGAALLKAELDVREAVRAHIPDLVGLLEGRENRSGLNSTAEWAASILAFLPEARDEAVPAILRGRGLLEPDQAPDTPPPRCRCATPGASRSPRSCSRWACWPTRPTPTPPSRSPGSWARATSTPSSPPPPRSPCSTASGCRTRPWSGCAGTAAPGSATPACSTTPGRTRARPPPWSWATWRWAAAGRRPPSSAPRCSRRR